MLHFQKWFKDWNYNHVIKNFFWPFNILLWSEHILIVFSSFHMTLLCKVSGTCQLVLLNINEVILLYSERYGCVYCFLTDRHSSYHDYYKDTQTCRKRKHQFSCSFSPRVVSLCSIVCCLCCGVCLTYLSSVWMK